jgi:hypothetical protein
VEDKKSLFYLRVQKHGIVLETRISADKSFILSEIENLKKVYLSSSVTFFFGELKEV